MVEEKRRLRRRYLLAEVKVKSSTSSRWIDAVLMNINRGGLGLYARGPLVKKDLVSVKIVYLERGRLRTSEEVPGVIRWVQEIGAHYSAGVMFREKVTRKNFPILSRCLDYARGNK